MDSSSFLANGGPAPTNNANASGGPPEEEDIDPIWLSSRTARQIYGLCQVEKDIGRLLSLAASSTSLLTLPQTDPPDAGLPQGAERSEKFVLVVSEYFERLDSIQTNIRSSLAHIRQSRIAPSAINAPRSDFVPPPLGAGLPSEGSRQNFGLQEERVERDTWNEILIALTKLKTTQSQPQSHDDHDMDTQSSQ